MAKTRFQNALLPSCLTSLILLQLLPIPIHGNGKAKFNVIGREDPILAVMGESKELPCHLSPSISAEDMELRWYRNHSSPAVYVYERGSDVDQEQMEEYRGRATLVRDGLSAGKAAVRIRNVSMFDSGIYHCHFKNDTSYKEATLWLKVVGPHSAPFSRAFQPGVWRTVLPLLLGALGLVTAGSICVFWKCQRERNQRILLEKEKESQEKACEEQPSSDRGPLLSGTLQEDELSWRLRDIRLVSPSLDPDTASSKLVLSEDLKSVSRLLFEQDLPDNPERFDQDPCVLGRAQFTSGRFYWEVKVGNRRAWSLGVCLDRLERKGRIPKSPKHGLWAVEFYKKKLSALTFPRIRLHPLEPLRHVGIFLDCEAGTISFYNGADGSLVYEFSGVSFSGSLRPFFCLWVHDPNPLTICSVSRETEEMTSPLLVSELPQGNFGTPISEGTATFSRDTSMFFSPQSSPAQLS